LEVEEDFREKREIMTKHLKLKLLKWEFTRMPGKAATDCTIYREAETFAGKRRPRKTRRALGRNFV